MMVSMAALQVFVVRFFFQGARKGTFYLFFLCGEEATSRVILAFMLYMGRLCKPALPCLRILFDGFR